MGRAQGRLYGNREGFEQAYVKRVVFFLVRVLLASGAWAETVLRVVEKHGVPIRFPTAWPQFPGGHFYGDPLWADEVAGRHPRVPIILTKMGRSITRYFKPETDARAAAKAA